MRDSDRGSMIDPLDSQIRSAQRANCIAEECITVRLRSYGMTYSSMQNSDPGDPIDRPRVHTLQYRYTNMCLVSYISARKAI